MSDYISNIEQDVRLYKAYYNYFCHDRKNVIQGSILGCRLLLSEQE